MNIKRKVMEQVNGITIYKKEIQIKGGAEFETVEIFDCDKTGKVKDNAEYQRVLKDYQLMSYPVKTIFKKMLRKYNRKELEQIQQDNQTELFNKFGVFFAFSKSGFNEKAKKGVKYVSLFSGMIAPEDNAKEFLSELDKQYDEITKLFHEHLGFYEIIKESYFNHETQITMDSTDAKESLINYIALFPEVYTDAKISEIYKECFNLAVKNDWF